MKLDLHTLQHEQDIETLRAASLSMIANLLARVEALERLAFGKRSERTRTGTSTPAASAPQASKQKEAQRGHGPREQPDLPVQEELHLLDEADQCCPKCGDLLEAMGEQVEQSEVIDSIPARYVLRRIKRQKYTCRCCGHIESALGPEQLPGERRYTPEFSAHVAQQKYGMHMPLSRQVEQMRTLGLRIDSQTLWDRLDTLATHLEPSYLALRGQILSQEVVGIDESEWRLLGKGRQKWPIWALRSEQAVFYQIRQSKGAQDVLELLEGFTGWAVSDGATCFVSAEKKARSWRAGRCLAHVRRKFVQAQQDFPEAQEAVELIGLLYATEERIKQGEIEANQGRAQIGRGLTWLEAWCTQVECLPESKLGKALGYCLRQMKYLKEVGEHPELWLDNNPTERSLRGPVLGRKNHYGSKSRRGTEVAAMLYSLVETCKLQGVDAQEYLREAALADARKPGTVTLPGNLSVSP